MRMVGRPDTGAVLALALLASLVACERGAYEIWVEVNRVDVSFAVWDPAVRDCGSWYPRQLADKTTDTDPNPEGCVECIDEVVITWPDERMPSHVEAVHDMTTKTLGGLAAGERVWLEVRGCHASKEAFVDVPTPRAALTATRSIEGSHVSVSWTDDEPADLACLFGGFGFSGKWTCEADTGSLSMSASFDPELHSMGASRLWRQTSEVGVSVWERQTLRIVEE